MATYAAQAMKSLTAVTPTFRAAAAGDKVGPFSERMFLYVKNGSGVSVTLTITSNPDPYVGAAAGKAYSIPAGAERLIGPFDASAFRQDADDTLALAWSATASVTWAALAFP